MSFLFDITEEPIAYVLYKQVLVINAVFEYAILYTRC